MSDAYVGEIRLMGITYAPINWMLCNGAMLNLSQNQMLFALIGTIYGGDGQTSFALPDLRGRVPIHQGQGTGLQNYPLGSKGGTETATVSTAQMPAHTHAAMASANQAAQTSPTGAVFGNVAPYVAYVPDTVKPTVKTLASTVVAASGGSQPHDNMMPSLALNFIICATGGIFPSQN